MDTSLALRAGELTLRLDPEAGAHVTDATCAARPDLPLVSRWWCGYEADGQRWSDSPIDGDRAFAVARARVEEFPSGSPVAVEVTTQSAAPHLHATRRLTVYRALPFIRVRYRFETTGIEGRGPGFSVALPGISFTGALADPFVLPEDTADDGIDLGGGLARPAWRAFGDPAGDFGLLVFSSSRHVMSRLQLLDRGCAFRPAYYLAYSTNLTTTREVRFGLEHQNFGPVDELDWFVGAFRRETLADLTRLIRAFHARRRPTGGGDALEYAPGEGEWDDSIPLDALPPPRPATATLRAGGETTRHFVLPQAIDAARPVAAHDVTATLTPEDGRTGHARLHVSVAGRASPGGRAVSIPLTTGALDVLVDVSPAVPLPAQPDGRVVGAAQLAGQARGVGWISADAPDLPGGVALLQRPRDGAHPVTLTPGLAGSYDVYVGIARGIGLKYRLPGDDYWSYVHAERTDFAERVDIQTWQPVSAICRPARGAGEVLLRRVVFDSAASLELAPHPYLNGYTVISHVRFAPAPPPTPVPSIAARRRRIVGLADIPDIGSDICTDAYHEEAWREIVAQHARVGIDTVYWRVDGQCADFHTTIGTVRYASARVHDVYSPRSRCYGRALERLDPLRIAVDEAAKSGLRVFGWMRANNYSSNVVSDFFLQHPEWHEEREDGGEAAQLCFAVPEVRAHKTAILREAAAYGLHGLMIDTLRHPPMVGYHPLVVAAYRERYGEAPPRDRADRAPRGRPERASDETWARWFRVRAGYFAQFIRDLRAGLAADGRRDFPIHIRVAPTRYLHDGADLAALLDERLVDTVVTSRYVADPLDYELLFPVVRGRVPIVALADPIRADQPQLLRDLARDARLGGIGIYESNRMVHTPRFRDALQEIALSSSM
jgi:hypothetical protein